MEWIILIVAGLFGGVAGGMGMGGGTILIPILTLYLDVPQLEAQMINLVAFIPMAVFSLSIHFKNKLVDTHKILYMLPSAIVFAVIGALLSGQVDKDVLRLIFGSFLIIISIVYLIKLVIDSVVKHISIRTRPSLCSKLSYYIAIKHSSINFM